jgi:tRNA(Ile)-lysidine synthase
MKARRRVDWRAAAAQAAALVPRARLHPAVVAWAEGRPRAERWGAALSGGADSVALLLLLWAHWPQRRARLVAFHFDHRLRGAESTADARFCAGLCRALGVPLVAGRGRARGAPSGEAQARAARFEFIGREMGRRRLRALWLGHQLDDVAESMLMRLARGSGTGGLAAPRPVHALSSAGPGAGWRCHLRPLLTLPKAEIARVLRAAGAPWREDSSNARGLFFRNRLRRDVIPRWARASQRDALSGAALSRELLEEDDRALEAWVDRAGALENDRALNLVRLAGSPRAVVRRALHRWLLAQPGAGELSRQGFEVLMRAVERGAPIRHSLGVEGFAVIRQGRLRFERARGLTPH